MICRYQLIRVELEVTDYHKQGMARFIVLRVHSLLGYFSFQLGHRGLRPLFRINKM